MPGAKGPRIERDREWRFRHEKAFVILYDALLKHF